MICNRLLAIVPARAGSKGLPNKNKMLIGGKPLFLWSCEAGKYLGIETYVSTNDEEIIKICDQKNIKYIKRPNEICSDDALDISFLQHFILALGLSEDNTSIINLRPTSPLRTTYDLRKFKEVAASVDGSIRSVELSKFPVQKMWFKSDGNKLRSVVSNQGNEPYNMPRQKLMPSYRQTGSFDSYRVKDVMSGSINGDKIYAFEQSIPTFDIDSEVDLLEARNFYVKNAGLFVY